MKQSNRANTAPKKQNTFLRRVLAFALTVVLVLGALAAVVHRDKLNLDFLRRWLTYRSIQTSQAGLAEPFTHGGGERLDMACLESGFLFASTAGAHYYSSGGVELNSQVTHMEKPVLSTSSRFGVVYDAGGESLFLFGSAHEPFVYSDPDNGGILSARVNNSGWLTVTGLHSHYRGGVTVYNAHHEPVISLNYSSAFVADAILSPDCRTVAVVTISQTDGAFQSTVHFHSTNATEPFATVALDGFTVLDMDFDTNGLWLLGESSLITLSAKGEEQAQYHFDPDYLKGYTLDGDGFAALLLGKYRAGSARELVTVGHDAQVLAQQDLNAQVLSISASGRYLSLLSGQELNVYTKDLSVYSTLYDTQGARHAAVYNDASVLLADSQEAWLYIPS